jgi:hypothetical protein
MTHNDMTHNAVSVESLMQNHDYLYALTTATLNAAAVAGASTDNARELTKFIVSCALPKGATIGSYPGELGYCGPGSPFGDWSSAPPTKECLQVVSSCILARTNALNKKVGISLRGDPPCLFSAHEGAPVVAETEYRENRGTPIPTFATCPLTGPAPGSDCGWHPGYVGRCKAGEQVTIAAQSESTAPCRCGGAPPVTRAGVGDLLRVCKGLYGCEKGPSKRAYAGYIEDQCECEDRAAVTFTCPTNGPLVDPSTDPMRGPRYGYFSVMAHGKGSKNGLPDPPVKVIASGNQVDYPAQEKDVFTYSEGAFYGYIFPLEAHGTCVKHAGPTAILADEMYACYGEIWGNGLQALTDRLCAHSATANCFGNAPQACFAPGSSGLDRCDTVPAPGHAYRACEGVSAPMPPWHYPITVYLNHPCDLSATGDCPIKYKVGQAGSPPQ